MSDEEYQTAEEAAKLLKSKIATRKGKLGACTRKTNEIKELMFEGGNIEEVENKMTILHSCFQDLKSANDSVFALIVDEMEQREGEDQNNWYEPRFMNIAFFLKEVEAWKKNE
jgi:hypothetical protein